MCEPVPRVEFVTDASYVCHVVSIIETGHFDSVRRKFSNGDLVQELSGSMCADNAASLAYIAIPSDVRKLAEQMVSHVESGTRKLVDHLKFLADFNRKRCQTLDDRKKVTRSIRCFDQELHMPGKMVSLMLH